MPVILAGTLPPGSNLFSSPPLNPRINDPHAPKPPPLPPIPRKFPRKPAANPNPALKSTHSRTKYYKPATDGVISTDGDRSVVVGESGVSYLLPGAPFEYQFSYSETPKLKPLAFREPAFLPFAPPTMPRPWTGKAPLKSKKEKELKRQKRVRLVEGFNPEQSRAGDGGKVMEMEKAVPHMGEYRKDGRSREEILGERLSRAEVRALVKPCLSYNRQVNLGRDGLTHNMLELIHSHWRRDKICKVRCRGVPTVDMDNVCHHLEEKTGGKIIYRVGGVIYLFRGRNYDPHMRPRYPVMLWKPAAPIYPKLIQEAPEGLSKLEADDMRSKGKNLIPICKLAKNGIYINLVKDVRDAFEESPLAKINCKGLEPSDYKKIGAKLKDLVPCVLLSFDDEQILMWRGKDWKSRYQSCTETVSSNHSTRNSSTHIIQNSGQENSGVSKPIEKKEITSRRILALWNQAIEGRKALLLDDCMLTPDALLEKVEDFEGACQAAEHSYKALILANNDTSDDADTDDSYSDGYAEKHDGNISDSCDDLKSTIPFGSMPVDIIVKQLGQY